MLTFARLFFFSLLLYATFSVAQSPKLVRGPYLQVVTPTSVVVRWRTDQPTTGRVWFGPNANQLTGSQTDTQAAVEHSLTLTGLQPATRYAYAVGYDATQLGTGTDYYLQTAPPAGDTRPMRLWVLGDFGNGTDNQRAVYQAFRTATATRPADLWLWLGDNAYCCGAEDQFQQYVFDVYAPTFRNLPFFPSPGNHDYADSNTNFDIPYYRLFSMPQRGESGGVAAYSPAYYSADYGNVHLISLDSQGTEGNQYRLYDTTGTQVQWLKRDLAANKLPWTIVFFHHPPYSKGGHNSDTEEQLKLLRENLTPILERYGVDLVLNGHSHGYERFYRLKNQTGLANTFDPAKHVAEATTARYDGTPNSCPMLTKGQGTVYVVNGAGGSLGGQSTDFPHPAAVYSNVTAGGSMLIDVSDNRLDAQYILTDGSVPDRFTLLRNVNKTTTLTAEYADTLLLTASWPGTPMPGDYRWSGASTTTQATRSIRYVANKAGTFSINVGDVRQCLSDQFTLNVQQPPRLTAQTTASICAGGSLAVTAQPENTTKAAGWQYDILLSDASGSFAGEQIVGSGTLNALRAIIPTSVSAGSGYRLRVRPRGVPYADLVPSGPLVVKALPTATLVGSATVLQGQPVSLTLSFTGDGPWQGSLSDGTPFSAAVSPAVLTVRPTQSGTFAVASVANGCGQGIGVGQASVTVLLPTETEEFAGGLLRVFPNPAQDVVYVDLTTTQRQEMSLTLRDAQGRLLYRKQSTPTISWHETISLPNPAGTYLLTVQVGRQTLTRKIMRQ